MSRVLAIFTCLVLFSGPAESGERVTVLHDGQATEIAAAVIEGDQLWLTPEDFRSASGFELKPEGACRGEVCVPISREPEDGLVRDDAGKTYVNLTKFAERLGQPVLVDVEHAVWAVGRAGESNPNKASSFAPDFELPDRQGKLVKLSDFRGKKVLLLSWASWCLCRNDLAGWQKLYDELKDRGFEIVAVAQDTGGEEAAGKYYDQAKATFTTLIDPRHEVSSLYHMVNVPMAVWIDEQGRIVRPAEVAYTSKVQMLSINVDGDQYVGALRDWIERGEQSQFVLDSAELAGRSAPPDRSAAEADLHFKLGVYLQQQGDLPAAEQHWAEAQRLQPDNWNYHRQAWFFTPAKANQNWMKKFRDLKGKPYYPPLDLGAKP